MLNQTAEYALRTAVHLAEHGRDDAVRAAVLADALGIPSNYLSKILHQLARQGILVSQRGKSGGFRLARDPAAISLADVVRPFDPVDAKRSCLLGRSVCSDRAPCEAHKEWKDVSTLVASFFHETTLARLVDDNVAKPRR